MLSPRYLAKRETEMNLPLRKMVVGEQHLKVYITYTDFVALTLIFHFLVQAATLVTASCNFGYCNIVF